VISGEILKRITMKAKVNTNNTDLMIRLIQIKSWNDMLYNANVSPPATSSVKPFHPGKRLHAIDSFDVVKADEIEEYDGNKASNSSAHNTISPRKEVVQDDGDQYKKHVGEEVNLPVS